MKSLRVSPLGKLFWCYCQGDPGNTEPNVATQQPFATKVSMAGYYISGIFFEAISASCTDFETFPCSDMASTSAISGPRLSHMILCH